MIMFKFFMSILLIIYSTRTNGLPAAGLSDSKEQVFADYDQNSNELNSYNSFEENEESSEKIKNFDIKLSNKNKFFMELLNKLKASKLFNIDHLINNDQNSQIANEEDLVNNENLKEENNSFKENKPNENIGYDGEIKKPNTDDNLIQLLKKRDCHLGLGMGHVCHAYTISKISQRQKALSSPKSPGRK